MRLLAVAIAVSLLAVPACVTGQTATRVAADTPHAPVPVKDILYARPFTLQRPYRNDWSKERAVVSSGVLVVLVVDPELVVPRDAALEPVLYAGNTTVQRLNHGDKSGRVIGIIPGNVDLAVTPIWFGAPDLPERVTAESARSERALAEKAGIRPFSAKKVDAVRHPPVGVSDLAALLRDLAAQLIDQYSPQEKALADAWRLPVAKAPVGRQP
jgi:hypothetical protein